MLDLRLTTCLILCASLATACGSDGSAEPDPDPDPDPPGPGEVNVRRDAHGIPHIESATDEGAMYGLGYATAQDRLLHMNLMAYAIQGRLSEVLGRMDMGGNDTVALDRQMRAFGYWRHAQSIVDALPADTRSLLDAYADGVNQYLADYPGGDSQLMTDLSIAPQTWTAAHSLGVWYWVGHFFSPDGLSESKGLHDFEDDVRAIGRDAAIESKLCDVHPGDPSAGVVQAVDVPQATQDAIAAYAASVGQTPYACPSNLMVSTQPMYYGHVAPKFSHAWVVGGANTTTGSSVLVSDPQTPVTFPAIWHEFAISGETIEARGIGIPGNPGILIGWNHDIAWGATAAGFDQTDLFRIELAGNRSDMYLLDGVATAMVVDTETIEIAGESPQTIDYRETVFGPMVTEFATDTQGEEFAARYIPFADADTDSIVAFFGMMRATSLDELNAALDDFRFPAVNLVAGDSSGNTMYRLIGAVPVRSTQSPLGGSIGQDGNSIDFQWQGTIPGELMPQVVNPTGGNVLSGNHRATGDWYPLSLGMGTGAKGDTHRSARIRELLADLPAQATPQEVLDDVQYDCVEVGRRDVALMGAHLASLDMLSPDATSAAVALDTWLANGGQTTADADGAYLASRMNSNFRIGDTGPQMQATYGGGGNGYTLFAKTMRESLAADPTFVPTADEIIFIDEMLATAWNAVQSTPQSSWQSAYTAEGTVSLDHFSLLGLPTVGTEQTDDVSLQCFIGTTVWSQKAQSYSQWVDLSDVDGSMAIMPPGNSEQVASPVAQSQASMWAAGTFRPAPLSVAAFAEITESALTLTMD